MCNMESAPDYFNKSKSIFYYTIKPIDVLKLLRKNKKRANLIHVFVKDKETGGVIYTVNLKLSDSVMEINM